MTRPSTVASLMLMLIMLALAPPTPAQSDPARVALDSWLDQINTGTEEALEGYITSSFTTAFLRQVPVEQMLGVHRQLMGVKPLALESIESDTGSELVALVSSTGGPSFRVQLNATGDPPLISRMLVGPVDDQDAARTQSREQAVSTIALPVAASS